MELLHFDTLKEFYRFLKNWSKEDPVKTARHELQHALKARELGYKPIYAALTYETPPQIESAMIDFDEPGPQDLENAERLRNDPEEWVEFSKLD